MPAEALPEPGSDELARGVAQRYHSDPAFNARVHLVWQHVQPGFLSTESQKVIHEVKAAIVLALYVDDIARGTAKAAPAGSTRTCRDCGCTDHRACFGGCWWVQINLCSSCLTKQLQRGERET